MVLAENPETGEIAQKRVVQTFENESDELVHVFVNGEEIITTPNHPFYVPKLGWTSAIKLRAGDILVLSNGEYVVVEFVQHEILESPVEVYNFEVEDFHTYFVGEVSVLVHNGCGTDDADVSSNVVTKRPQSKRTQYLGRTPSKNSATGRQVIDNMRAQGRIRGEGENMEFYSEKGQQWYPIAEADMAHKTNAVTWWNTEGKYYGAKSSEVRQWMLSAENYELEHYSINRSEGALLRASGITYDPPLS